MSMSVYPKITGDLDPPIRIALAHLNVSCYKNNMIGDDGDDDGGGDDGDDDDGDDDDVVMVVVMIGDGEDDNVI
jgi:hypothetical protein